MRSTARWLTLSIAALGLVGMTGCGATDGTASGGSSGSETSDDAGVGGDSDDYDPSSDPDSGGSQSCSGCVHGPTNTCVQGTADEACGANGEQCVECGTNETCEDGTCVAQECSSATCDGCCKNGECLDGTAKDACGAGGKLCSTCGETARCVEQSCETCDGCWGSDGTCKSGESDSACGAGGSACVECAQNETCENGSCVEEASDNCSQTCSGCCDGDQCKDGTSNAACGTGGDSCVTCSNNQTCNAGSCEASPQTEYDIVAVSSEITDNNGSSDIATGADPYVEVTVGNSTKKTSDIDDTLNPKWNEKTVTGVTASEISGLTYHIRDHDDVSGDDPIVTDCKPTFTPSDIQSGTASHTCSNGGEATTEFRFDVSSGGGSN